MNSKQFLKCKKILVNEFTLNRSALAKSGWNLLIMLFATWSSSFTALVSSRKKCNEVEQDSTNTKQVGHTESQSELSLRKHKVKKCNYFVLVIVGNFRNHPGKVIFSLKSLGAK